MDVTDVDEIVNTATATHVRDSIYINTWMGEKLKKLGCQRTADLTAAKVKVPLKDDLAHWLHGALLFMNRQNEVIKDLTDQNPDGSAQGWTY